MIPQIYDDVKDKLKSEVKDKFVSLTTDGWTSRATESYITITSCHIDSKWELKNYVLQFNIGSPCPKSTCAVRQMCIGLTNGRHTCIQMPALEGDMVLKGGSNPAEGRLEIYYKGQWGPIISFGSWPNNAVSVACKQLLNYRYGIAVINNHGTIFGQSSSPDLIYGVLCQENEEKLIECPHQDLAPNYDQKYYNVGLICSNTPFENGDKAPIRLSGGSTAGDGVLEIFFAGHWGSMVNVNGEFGETGALVVCRQLNYTGGIALDTSYFNGYQRSLVWRKAPLCEGTEEYLSQCAPKSEWGNFLAHMDRNDVVVVCEDPNRLDAVRLVDGDVPYEGRVEIQHAGVWGRVSLNGWDNRDASVVCRQLGYSTGIVVVNHLFGYGSIMFVWVYSVNCSGTEEHISLCSNGGWAANKFDFSYGVGAVCSQHELNQTAEGAVRLVDGASEYKGRAEIYFLGRWRSICSRLWDYKASQVVCRQLGYKDGAIYLGVAPGEGYYLMDGFKCHGNESRLSDCTLKYLSTVCRHDEAVGIVCSSNNTFENEGMVSLKGPSLSAGRLEIYHSGHWGTIWQSSLWTTSNAIVVCKALGFSSLGTPLHYSFFGGVDQGPVWMSDVICQGTENRLDECAFGGWGVQTLFPPKGQIVYGIGVVCGTSTDYGNIRLVGSGASNEGRVEIHGPSGYGTISKTSITDAVYYVVCKELGYNYGVQRSFGQGTGPVYVQKIFCNGGEQKLEHCRTSGWETSFNHTDDIAVQCGM